MVAAHEDVVAKLRADKVALDETIKGLRETLAKQTSASEEVIQSLNSDIQGLQHETLENDDKLRNLQATLEAREEESECVVRELKAKDRMIRALQEETEAKDALLQAQAQRDVVKSRSEGARGLSEDAEAELAKMDLQIQTLFKELASKEEHVAAVRADAAPKDMRILSLQTLMSAQTTAHLRRVEELEAELSLLRSNQGAAGASSSAPTST